MSNKELFLDCIKDNPNQLTIRQLQDLTGLSRTTIVRYCDKFNYKPLKHTEPWNKGLTKETNNILKNISAKTTGVKRRARTKEEKKKISSAMKKNNNSGGYREFGGRGTSHIYRGIIFNSDSSFGVAKMFDDEDIDWEQPIQGFDYIDQNGEKRCIHVEFYLPKYDLYVTVKTSITSTVRKNLLNVKNSYKIKLIIVDELMYKRFIYNNITEIIEKIKE